MRPLTKHELAWVFIIGVVVMMIAGFWPAALTVVIIATLVSITIPKDKPKT